MSEAKREALARVLCKAEHAAPDPDVHIYIGMKAAKAWEARLPMVDALLRELREPDEEMLETLGGSPFALPRKVWRQEAVTVWQAMIDHLREKVDA